MPPKNAATAATASAPATPAASSAPPLSDYVRDAVREKASRDWQRLRERSEAFGAIERVLQTLAATERELAVAAPILLPAAPEAGLPSKIKKLRRSVDEASALSRDIVDALGGATSRESLEEARRAILDALRSAGLDEAALEPQKVLEVASEGPAGADVAEWPAIGGAAPPAG